MQTFQNNISLLKIASWAFINACRGTPPPAGRYFIPTQSCDIFPTLAALFQASDMELVINASWSLSHLTDIVDFSKYVIAGGMCAHLMRALEVGCLSPLQHGDINMLFPSIRAVGTIATGSDTETQAVIDAGVLPRILPLLNNPKKSVRREACWLLSNIAAGTREQVRLIAVERGIFERVIELLDSSQPMEVREEAAFVVCNAATKGSDDVTNVLFKQGALHAIVDLLGCFKYEQANTKLLPEILEALTTAMRLGNSSNHFQQLLINCGTLTTLRIIQKNTTNTEAMPLARKLIAQLRKYQSRKQQDSMDSE
ncbi:importin alpha [Pelomyxa schiedti]|nr:importin alpha [Pelomyxa schiedti]